VTALFSADQDRCQARQSQVDEPLVLRAFDRMELGL
jgi:hypothetical protein